MALNVGKVTLLCGGVGGAKLAYGLAQIIPPADLSIIVNTGDDFWHYGLRICPDVDTVLYTLAGIVNPATGWGLRDESHHVMDALRSRFGVDPWFQLGDADLATHLFRTDQLQQGATLTESTRHQARSLAVRATVLPMCDEEMPTVLDCADEGLLDFQTYFVRLKQEPRIRSILYQNAEKAKLSPAVAKAIAEADVILIAPSNPWLSIAPILHVPGIQEAIRSRNVPKVAVSPIVAGKAIKGPAAQIMQQLGIPARASSVARYYSQWIDGFVFDQQDRDERQTLSSQEIQRSTTMDTLMINSAAKIRLAEEILAWVARWN